MWIIVNGLLDIIELKLLYIYQRFCATIYFAEYLIIYDGNNITKEGPESVVDFSNINQCKNLFPSVEKYGILLTNFEPGNQ